MRFGHIDINRITIAWIRSESAQCSHVISISWMEFCNVCLVWAFHSMCVILCWHTKRETHLSPVSVGNEFAANKFDHSIPFVFCFSIRRCCLTAMCIVYCRWNLAARYSMMEENIRSASNSPHFHGNISFANAFACACHIGIRFTVTANLQAYFIRNTHTGLSQVR